MDVIAKRTSNRSLNPFINNNLVTFSRFKAQQPVYLVRRIRRIVPYFDDFQLSNTEPAGLDFDQDGLLNSLERSLPNLFSADTDKDGLPDLWNTITDLIC